MSTDVLKLLGFTLAGLLVVGAVLVPAAAPALNVLAGAVMGWLGLRRPNDIAGGK